MFNCEFNLALTIPLPRFTFERVGLNQVANAVVHEWRSLRFSRKRRYLSPRGLGNLVSFPFVRSRFNPTLRMMSRPPGNSQPVASNHHPRVRCFDCFLSHPIQIARRICCLRVLGLKQHHASIKTPADVMSVDS